MEVETDDGIFGIDVIGDNMDVNRAEGITNAEIFVRLNETENFIKIGYFCVHHFPEIYSHCSCSFFSVL